MSLSRKHFEAIAQIIRENTIKDFSKDEFGNLVHPQFYIYKGDLIHCLEGYFLSINPNFDSYKFAQACNDDGGQDD